MGIVCSGIVAILEINLEDGTTQDEVHLGFRGRHQAARIEGSAFHVWPNEGLHKGPPEFVGVRFSGIDSLVQSENRLRIYSSHVEDVREGVHGPPWAADFG